VLIVKLQQYYVPVSVVVALCLTESWPWLHGSSALDARLLVSLLEYLVQQSPTDDLVKLSNYVSHTRQL